MSTLMNALLETGQTSSIQQKNRSSLSPAANKSRKIKLVLIDQECEKQSGIDPELILKAMNNSFTKRMGGGDQQISIFQIILAINDFALKEASKKKAYDEIVNRKWCVIELDEKTMAKSGIGNLGSGIKELFATCSEDKAQTDYEMTIQNGIYLLPNTLQLYSLVFNLNCRQLQFQSLDQSTNRFFINLDTVTVKLEEQSIYQTKQVERYSNKFENIQQANNRILIKPLIMSVKSNEFPLTLHVYITQRTIPFPYNRQASGKDQQQFLLLSRKSLYDLLKKSISQSRGNQFELTKAVEVSLKNDTQLYNNKFVTEEQFSKFCETGDLLLFRDSHTMAKIQRFVTNSPYDHIGVVFRSENLGICLFQSNSGLGVAMASWNQLIRYHWFENIEKIAWRKLQVHEKPENFDEKVAQFIKANLHKQYGINISKLLKFRTGTQSPETKKTYFCSQLVATLYQYLGIIEQTKSPTQYWPKNFADGGNLQILNGALDPERQIIFQDQILKETYRYYK